MSKSTLEMTHDEWLLDRRKGIGGSDVATILGLNKWKSPYQLWLEKTGQIGLEHTESEPAYWGNVLEEVVAKEFQERTGKKVRRRNQVFEHPLHPFGSHIQMKYLMNLRRSLTQTMMMMSTACPKR